MFSGKSLWMAECQDVVDLLYMLYLCTTINPQQIKVMEFGLRILLHRHSVILLTIFQSYLLA